VPRLVASVTADARETSRIVEPLDVRSVARKAPEVRTAVHAHATARVSKRGFKLREDIRRLRRMSGSGEKIRRDGVSG
jgi:hypothetical protein